MSECGPDERLRILIITFDPPENVGGVEGRAIGYTKGFSSRGHHVSVVAFGRDYGFSVEPFQGALLHRFSSRPASFPPALRHLVRLARSDRADSVFVLSGATTLLGVCILLYFRLLRKRSAVFLYGKDILTAKGSIPDRALLFLSELLADVEVTNSHYTSSLLPNFIRLKEEVLYPSVDENVLSRPPEGAQMGGQRILMVGRLVKRKGADDLIRAFRIVAENHPDARLEIVGEGPERRGLENLVSELNLSQKVTFYGELRGDSLYERYRQCVVFAMASKTLEGDVEGFGTVFLEAGLFGKPSVGSTSGGIPEAVLEGETGLLVQEGDVPGLADALKTLLEDGELRQRLGSGAQRRVLREFTWKDGTDRLTAILAGMKRKVDEMHPNG